MILRQLCKEQRGDTRVARECATAVFVTKDDHIVAEIADLITTVRGH